MTAIQIDALAQMPVLVGSDKQVAWAERIRAERIAEADRLMADAWSAAERAGYDPAVVIAPQAQQIADAVSREASAAWWIDTGQRLALKRLVAELQGR